MKDFKDRLVFITGGSSGIGYALAEAFLNEEASVVLISRSYGKLKAAEEKLQLATSTLGRIHLCSLDITDNAKVSEVLGGLIGEIGSPDILINCAGTAHPDYFENISYDLFRHTMALNLEGSWNVLSAAVPGMKKKRAGHIVNVSSVAGFIGTFGYTAYSASKFAVIGLSETLRGELKPHGIDVSILCPPDTDTPGFEEENKTKPPETVAISGNVKLMSPEDVASVVIKGIKKKKFMIIPGGMGKLTFVLKSVLPSLVFRIMDSDAKKTRKTGV